MRRMNCEGFTKKNNLVINAMLDVCISVVSFDISRSEVG